MEEKAETAGGPRLNPELPRLIFLGTPDFACASLEKLIDCGADIPLVVTQPDRPKGRGRILTPPPVKMLARQNLIKVYQPKRIRDSSVIDHIKSYDAECLVLVAYGQIIPPQLLEAFSLGAINVHPSLLPLYRGAAPIQRALLADESVTGVSIMLMDHGLDSGPVLAQKQVAITENDNFGTLHDKLANAGAELLCTTLKLWRLKQIEPVPQDDSRATLAPPIDKDELKIDWQWPARRIVNTIRAFDPWPGAYCLFRDKRLKCFQAKTLPWSGNSNAGEILGLSKEGIVVVGGDGNTLAIGAVQLSGKRRFSAADFAHGYHISSGARFD